MKKLVLVLTSLIILTIVFLITVLVIDKDKGIGALQVTAIPKSKVYLNGSYIGDTPLCKCELEQMLPVGEYLVKVEPMSSPSSSFEQKIRVNTQALTVVDRTFSREPSGSVITLNSIQNKKRAEVLVVSFPSDARVFFDNNDQGKTPLILKNLTASDHEIRLTKEGFNDKIVKIRTVEGFQLEALVFLSVKASIENLETASPSAAQRIGLVEILETPTGFLRARSRASLSSEEVGRVNPGERFDLLSEQEGWYEIRLVNGASGWISSEYSTKR